MTKILVADDAPDVRSLLTEMLRKDGYEVVAAADGKHAVELTAAERPDLILLDIMMPEMDGIAACRRLKSDPRLHNIPVILVTAKAADDDVVQGLDVGADDYVTKPFRKEILAARVRSALRVKRDHDTILRINDQLRAEIAERKRMEGELARAQRLESIGQLAAGIAHEINTPNQYIGDNVRFMQQAFTEVQRAIGALRAILQEAKEAPPGDRLAGRLEAVLQQAGTDQFAEEIPKAAREALEGVQSVAHTVRAMRAFAEAGARLKSPTNVPEAIQNAIIVCRSQWKDVAEVVTDFDPRLPLVPCVPADLGEVILQLLRNAAWAIAEAAGHHPQDGRGPPEKGTITVRARRDNGRLEIRVEDTGIGIREDIRSRVFEPFFTTRPVGEAAGQGLAIALASVGRLGGTITFETETGRGTTFIVRLPLD
jgi:signal transduction histidine kinase